MLQIFANIRLFLFYRFIKQYRLPQTIAFRLIDVIRPFIDDIGEVPLYIQILSVLNFYASGSYQM